MKTVRFRTRAMLLASLTPLALLLLLGSPAQAAAPLAFTGATAAQQATGDVRITWSISGSDPTLTGFRVDRVDGAVVTPVASVGPNARSATDPLTGVSTGVHLFTYNIVALAGATEITSTTAIPSAIYQNVPSGPATIDVTTSGNRVTLRWTGPEVNAALLTGYRIERRIGATGPFTVIVATQTGASYVDTVTGLPTGITDVYYRVISLAGTDAGGANEPIAQIFIGVPSTPTNGKVRMGFDGDAGVVSWGPPTDNAGLVTGYRIARSVGGGPETVLGTVGAGVRQFVDPSLESVPDGTSVTYTVTALSAAGPGGALPILFTVRHTPLAMPEPTVTPKVCALLVRWAAPDTGGVPVQSYVVRYRAVGTEPWTSVPAGEVDSAKREAFIKELRGGVRYEVEVAAVDVPGAGQSAWSPPATGTPKEGLPVTGADAWSLGQLGAASVVAGALLLVVTRRRRPVVASF